METRKTENCMICGEELEYLNTGIPVTCTYCGKAESANIHCPSRHYVCNECHASDSIKIITQFCLSSTYLSRLSQIQLQRIQNNQNIKKKDFIFNSSLTNQSYPHIHSKMIFYQHNLSQFHQNFQYDTLKFPFEVLLSRL